MIYAKGIGETEVWHIVNGYDIDNTVTVVCGYPDMPDLPRHSGRFLPTFQLGTASQPADAVCEECEAIAGVDTGFEAFCAEENEL